MASFLRGLKHLLAHHGHHQKAQDKAPNPALALAKNFTGSFAFLDEQTNKTHSLAISPQLQIKIDNKTLPGQVVGITINELTFLDHYGYKLRRMITVRKPFMTRQKMLPTPLSFPAHKMQKVRSENRIALFLCERELARLGIGV